MNRTEKINEYKAEYGKTPRQGLVDATVASMIRNGFADAHRCAERVIAAQRKAHIEYAMTLYYMNVSETGFKRFLSEVEREFEKQRAEIEESFDGKITKLDSDIVDGATVETWYDDQSDNWITQLKTAEGYQIGDAMYAGDVFGAREAHRLMTIEADDRFQKELIERAGGPWEIEEVEEERTELVEITGDEHGLASVVVRASAQLDDEDGEPNGDFVYAIVDADSGIVITAAAGYASIEQALAAGVSDARSAGRHFIEEVKPHEVIAVELTEPQADWVGWALGAMYSITEQEIEELHDGIDVEQSLRLKGVTLLIRRFDNEQQPIGERADIADLFYRLERQAEDMMYDEISNGEGIGARAKARAAANAAERIREELAKVQLQDELDDDRCGNCGATVWDNWPRQQLRICLKCGREEPLPEDSELNDYISHEHGFARFTEDDLEDGDRRFDESRESAS